MKIHLEKECKAHLLANQDLWSNENYEEYLKKIESKYNL